MIANFPADCTWPDLGHTGGEETFPGPGILVPVPLHPKRLRKRGFNQSLEIARHFGKIQGNQVVNALERVRDTIPQMILDRSARRNNISRAFKADPEKISGREVILVDDIMTTGATLSECARELAKAGARKTEVIVLSKA